MREFTYRIPATRSLTLRPADMRVWAEGQIVLCDDGSGPHTIGDMGDAMGAAMFVDSLRDEQMLMAHEEALAEDAVRFPAVSSLTREQRREINDMIMRRIALALYTMEQSAEILGQTHSEEVCDTVADIVEHVRSVLGDYEG